jgi:hypothetical protein
MVSDKILKEIRKTVRGIWCRRVNDFATGAYSSYFVGSIVYRSMWHDDGRVFAHAPARFG